MGFEEVYKKKAIENKISDYYKQKFIEKKITENNQKKFIEDGLEEDYKKRYVKDEIKENYNKKSQVEKIVYKYVKLREVRTIYKILNNLSSRINRQMKKKGTKREFTYTQIMGCTVKELEEYLSSKMKTGMTYENYPEWEVDHIIPFSKFDFTKIEEIKKCCHYSNLQPLPKEENRIKSNKLLIS